MAIDSQFPAQLIAMVSNEAKASYRAEADSRRVSIGQVVRERLDLADAALAGRVVGPTVYPDKASADDAIEQLAVNLADERDIAAHAPVSDTGQGGQTVRDRDEDDDDEDATGPSLAELAAALPPDDGIEDTDEHLAYSGHGEGSLARLQARGLL